mgnify:CR=1 FL=1
MPARVAHQISDVFVSHAHFDHIGGFLWLLRSRIGVSGVCRLYGPPGLTRQRLFAALCAVVAFWLFSVGPQAPADFMPATALERWLPVVIAVGFVIVILLTRRVDACGDATGEPLSLARVRAGMWVGLFVAAQSLLGGPEALRPLWWALALGSCLGGNGSLVGASANLIVAGFAERSGQPIRFLPFMLMAFPLMLVSIAISTVYVYWRYF